MAFGLRALLIGSALLNGHPSSCILPETSTNTMLGCRVSADDMIPAPIESASTHHPDLWCEGAKEVMSQLAYENFETVQRALDTPDKVGMYIQVNLKHGGREFDQRTFQTDYWMSGLYTNTIKQGDCDDAAVFAASCLKDNKFKPYILVIRGFTPINEGIEVTSKGGKIQREECFGHAVFLYKTLDGKFGSLGMNKIDNRPACHSSIDEFLTDFSTELGDTFSEYLIYDISRLNSHYDTYKCNNSPEQ